MPTKLNRGNTRFVLFFNHEEIMKKLLLSLTALLALTVFPLATQAAVVDVNAPSTTDASIRQDQILSQVHQLFTNNNMFGKGDNCGVMVATVTAGASDSNGSTYRVFNNLDAGLVPVMILIGNTLNTAGTSYSLGLYSGSANGTTGGTAISANLFANAQTMASARTSMNPSVALDGMSAVLPASYGQPLWKLAGDANNATRPLGYDLTITANTAGSAGGTMTVAIYYTVPQHQ